MNVLTLALSLFAASGTGSPTSTYLATRDQAIAAIQAAAEHESAEASDARTKRALDSLQPMLRSLVGPLRIDGFPLDGTSNLDTLTNEVGYGKLDGLAASSLDGKTQVVVSTLPLLQAWLAGHRHWLPEQADNPPTEVPTAFRSEGFYTQALDNDAHAYKFANIPVIARGKDGIAAAILFEYGQDLVAPNPPDMIAVATVQDGRVFVFTQSTAKHRIPACQAAYERAQKAVVAVPNQVTGARRDALLEKSERVAEQTNSVFQHCYETQIRSQDYYPALLRQAQALVDRVLPK